MKNKKNINERFLRQIWQKRIFEQDGLKTLDETPLEIISPGFVNDDGGPDFSKAKIRIGEIIYEGDIEIHRDISDWLLHSHAGNPKYNNTILHVVLYGQSSFVPTFTHSGRKIPVFVLEDYLSKPLSDVWEEAIVEDREDRQKTIPCDKKNEVISLDKKYIWLERLGYRRLEARIKHLEDRLNSTIEFSETHKNNNLMETTATLNHDKSLNERKRDIRFWEQLFYEGIMEGMGYSKNREPFLKLSNILDLEFLRHRLDLSRSESVTKIQSILFGISGLIPPISEVKDEETLNYINFLYAYWNEFEAVYKKEKLNKNEWQFFRLRPQNFPTIRLAGISFLMPFLIQGTLFKNLLQTIKQCDNKVDKSIEKLTNLFSVEASGYWCTHFNFTSETRKETKLLIGQNRIGDIIVNTLIPIAVLYARFFKDFRTEKSAMSLYHFYPCLSDNDASKIISEHLLQNNPIKSAKQQQGAIQLYKFYCTFEKCSKCDIGKALDGNLKTLKDQRDR